MNKKSVYIQNKIVHLKTLIAAKSASIHKLNKEQNEVRIELQRTLENKTEDQIKDQNEIQGETSSYLQE
ncbi:hypothetical protein QNI16_18680 [Cytophagaceae bacterium YF14B1]|uniref:Uncharacterized protein n=1 Tax=Xanthocytophaga flava TaxID=3048013 RepID=A0AAE3U7L0_9BACT|nr:hypothetical protein [Xanthocytophaga flavus]MDJ1482536.1 hypothetical protein [Xanthocytophaga flavus]